MRVSKCGECKEHIGRRSACSFQGYFIDTHCQKLKQKIALLPRLTERQSSRIVVLKTSDNGESTVSESYWDVYLETLSVQGKKAEALEALGKIQGTPMPSSGAATSDGPSTENNTLLPQIDDEETIENHVGSILPASQRNKLEWLVQLSQELGMYQEAEGY